jgi:hypothetical protein
MRFAAYVNEFIGWFAACFSFLGIARKSVHLFWECSRNLKINSNNGTVSRDFLALVFFHRTSPSRPESHFIIFLQKAAKFTKICAVLRYSSARLLFFFLHILQLWFFSSKVSILGRDSYPKFCSHLYFQICRVICSHLHFQICRVIPFWSLTPRYMMQRGVK